MRLTRIHRRPHFLILAAAMGGVAGFAAGPVAAAPTMNVSFYTQGASTAQWLPNHSAIQVTVPNSSSYGIIVVHHFPSILPTTEPSFTTDTYSSGSPRWYIQLSNGSYLFGYPSQYSDYWNVEGCGAIDAGTGYTYADALAALSTAECYGSGVTVTGVYIVSDSSQGYPATNDISAIQYDNVDLTTS